MQPYLANLGIGKICANMGKIWANLEIWIRFCYVWAKIKTLYPQKHSISYGYDKAVQCNKLCKVPVM